MGGPPSAVMWTASTPQPAYLALPPGDFFVRAFRS